VGPGYARLVRDAERPPGTIRPRRFLPRFHYELLACGVSGHELVGTDVAGVEPQDATVGFERYGVRWHRCLRCDSWLPLPPPAHAAREHMPVREEIELPLRGRPLRDKVVLRLIALDRALHFVVLAALGIAILLFASRQAQLRGEFYRVASAIQRGVGGGPVQADRVGLIGELNKLFSLRSSTLTASGFGILGYGVLEGVEAIGLWWQRRWAEYLTFIATAVFLPLEVWEMAHRFTPFKVFAFILNVAVVIYLLWAKRLFGIRGGGQAERRERERDIGWDALERATPWAAVGASAPGRSAG
jgi:uncharacterized membrane protein (DUF2068 family)